MAKYSTGIEDDTVAGAVELPDPEADELDVDELEYLVDQSFEAGHGVSVEGYFFQGVDQALEASGVDPERRHDEIVESKLEEEGLDEVDLERLDDLHSDAIVYTVERLDEAWEEVQNLDSREPMAFAAIQGSLGQGTCVPPALRRGVDEVGDVDSDVFIIGNDYEGSKWRHDTLDNMRNEHVDKNTRKLMEYVESCPNYYSMLNQMEVEEKHLEPEDLDCRKEKVPEEFRLPIHPIGITRKHITADGAQPLETPGNHIMSRYQLNPYSEEWDSVRKKLSTFIVNMWEGAFIPEQYADPEIMEGISRMMDMYTDEDGRLYRGKLNLPSNEEERLEEKYGEGIFV